MVTSQTAAMLLSAATSVWYCKISHPMTQPRLRLGLSIHVVMSTDLTFSSLTHLQKPTLWLNDQIHHLVQMYLLYRSCHKSGAWAGCPVGKEIPWQQMCYSCCLYRFLNKLLCFSFFGAMTKRSAQVLSRKKVPRTTLKDNLCWSVWKINLNNKVSHLKENLQTLK